MGRLFGGYLKLLGTNRDFRRFVSLLCYQVLGVLRRDSSWTFMNYGYAPVAEADDRVGDERYCASLYRNIAGAIDLRGAEVLEVGCGRGGGAAFVMSRLGPASVVGLDNAPRNITLCRKIHPLSGLTFLAGDAEKLPFPGDSFDVVLNVESSHCYASIDAFLSEVYRVLRPAGWFLFADFRYSEAVARLDEALARAGFSRVRKADITANVVQSLREDGPRRLTLIEQSAPRLVRGPLRQFAGVEGSRIRDDFATGRRRYLSWVLGKPASRPGGPSEQLSARASQ